MSYARFYPLKTELCSEDFFGLNLLFLHDLLRFRGSSTPLGGLKVPLERHLELSGLVSVGPPLAGAPLFDLPGKDVPRLEQLRDPSRGDGLTVRDLGPGPILHLL